MGMAALKGWWWMQCVSCSHPPLFVCWGGGSVTCPRVFECSRAFVHMHMGMEARGQPSGSSHIIFWDMSPHWNLSLSDWARMTGQRASGIPLSLPSQHWIQAFTTLPGLFHGHCCSKSVPDACKASPLPIELFPQDPSFLKSVCYLNFCTLRNLGSVCMLSKWSTNWATPQPLSTSCVNDTPAQLPHQFLWPLIIPGMHAICQLQTLHLIKSMLPTRSERDFVLTTVESNCVWTKTKMSRNPCVDSSASGSSCYIGFSSFSLLLPYPGQPTLAICVLSTTAGTQAFAVWAFSPMARTRHASLRHSAPWPEPCVTCISEPRSGCLSAFPQFLDLLSPHPITVALCKLI